MPFHRILFPREFFTRMKSVVGRTRPRKICFLSAAVLLLLLALYTVLGFFVLPLAVQRVLSGYVQEKLHLQLRMEAVRFNPFLLRAEVKQLKLEEPGGTPLAGFKGFAADLEWSSLWKGVWTLSELSLEEPGVNLALEANGVPQSDPAARTRGILGCSRYAEHSAFESRASQGGARGGDFHRQAACGACIRAHPAPGF